VRRSTLIGVVFLLLTAAGAMAADTAGSAGVAPKRPAILVPLYAGFAALQILDAHSTLEATSVGAQEINPLMQGPSNNPAAMLAVKAGTAAGIVVISEKLWRRNRTAAIVTMISLNSAYLVIAAHNYAEAQR
jgi:hypothetical protein